MSVTRPALQSATLIVCALLLPACAHYTVPGGAANLRRAIGIERADANAPAVEYDIAKQLDKRPSANFPATLALLRIQEPGYRSHTARSVNRGNYAIVTVRDIEKDEDLARLHRMPGVGAVVPLNKMVVGDLRSERDLREAAARVQADALVLYTFDTQFTVETTIPALGVLTLGLFPNDEARVTSTASAAIIDTRTGFVYALAESTHDTTQLANAWTNKDAVDQSRRRAERKAFEGLITEIERAWTGAVRAHSGRVHVVPVPASNDGGGWIHEGGRR